MSDEKMSAENRCDQILNALPRGNEYSGPYRPIPYRDAVRIAEEHAEAAVEEMRRERDDIRTKLAACVAAKDGAYSERNALVAALSRVFPGVLSRHPDEDESWEDDWRWIVFIDIPVIRYLTFGDQRNGPGPHYVIESKQASWHIHDSELPLFSHLPREQRVWDGHTTEEKYARLAALRLCGEEVKP